MADTIPVPWGDIVRLVGEQLGLPKKPSATLDQMLRNGARYVQADGRGPLQFDMRALYLGMIEAGRGDRVSRRLGNTASWFAAWMSEIVGAAAVDRALSADAKTEPELIAASLADGPSVAVAEPVLRLGELARKIAVDTGRPPVIEARHLFAAMLLTGAIVEETHRAFGVDVAGRTDDLKAHLVARIMDNPLRGETTELWCAALGIAPELVAAATAPPPPRPPGATDAPPAEPPEEGVTGFSRDSVPPSPTDPLRTQGDAEALARLMCLEDAAPLAVAVFGGWGSGKSTFMNRVDAAVRRITEDQGEGEVAEAAPGAPVAHFVERVVQIRFNAWQFVDANLWASLTSEFFDQLRAGGWDRTGGARHAGLVERVNRHVHSLSAEVEARREAAATGGKEVLRAQQVRDVAAKAARNAAPAVLGQAALDALGEAYEAQRKNLSALGLAVSGDDTSKAVDAIIDAAASTRSIGGQALAIWRVLSKSKGRLVLSLVLVVVAMAATGTLIWLVMDRPDDVRRWIGAIATAVTALGAAALTASPALKLVRDIAKRGADIAGKVDKASRQTLNKLLQSEVALREATVEAEALRAAAAQASQQLARYVSPDGKPNPPRLLRYVLEDDPDTKALAAEIGLIGRTRRLFQTVDDIAREERRTKADDRTAPDRIVLYIDDLDRCTDEQVYNVLQAIHLLLAFELFVVVVGVDVKRVQGALARALAPREASGMDDDDIAGLAASYLEKIFQIAFWLAPLAADDPQGGSFGRYVRDLATPPPAPARTPPAKPAATTGPAAARSAPGQPGDAAAEPAASERGDEPAPDEPEDAVQRRRRGLATIQLTQDEVDFLASPFIAGVAARTPRGVKRLLNVYRLVRSRLAAEGVSILGDPSGAPPAYPLIALMVAVETGQSVDVADEFFEGLMGLPASDTLNQVFRAPPPDVPRLPGAGIGAAYAACPALEAAMNEVLRLRGLNLRADAALKIARVARRFSFNVNA